MRVVKHWNGLSREAVTAPSLAVFKVRLAGALSTLVSWKMSLLVAGDLEPDDLSSPFQTYDSMSLSFNLSCFFQNLMFFLLASLADTILKNC